MALEGQILQLLNKSQGISVRQIVEELKCDPKYVYKLLLNLVNKKAVLKVKTFYFVTTLGKKLAAQAFIADYMAGKIEGV